MRHAFTFFSCWHWYSSTDREHCAPHWFPGFRRGFGVSLYWSQEGTYKVFFLGKRSSRQIKHNM